MAFVNTVLERMWWWVFVPTTINGLCEYSTGEDVVVGLCTYNKWPREYSTGEDVVVGLCTYNNKWPL
jgi:hypothetical protein